ncbi:hypothetical protein H0H93_008225 [Arthromyces matolae]|nr:hypothetical protein H0H93_008225 [Arthromyces matolae]
MLLNLPRDVAVAGSVLLALVQIAGATPIPPQALRTGNDNNVLVARQPTASHDITARSWIAMHLAEDLNGRTILNERRALDERGLHNDGPLTPESAHAEETKPETSKDPEAGLIHDQSNGLNALAGIATDLELKQAQKATLESHRAAIVKISGDIAKSKTNAEKWNLQLDLDKEWHDLLTFVAGYMKPTQYSFKSPGCKQSYQDLLKFQIKRMHERAKKKAGDADKEVLQKLQQQAEGYLKEYEKIVDNFE